MACVGVAMAVAGPTQANAQPLGDVAAVSTALESAAMPISTRTAASVATTLSRIASGTPRYNYFPRSVHLVEGQAQPFLYDTAAADCLPSGFGRDNYSVGIAEAIAGRRKSASADYSSGPGECVFQRYEHSHVLTPPS